MVIICDHIPVRQIRANSYGLWKYVNLRWAGFWYEIFNEGTEKLSSRREKKAACNGNTEDYQGIIDANKHCQNTKK